MTYVPTKEIKIKERQDKFLKAQLEKEREQALLEEIEKTEKERVKKKGKVKSIVDNLLKDITVIVTLNFVFDICRFESFEI